MLEHIPARLLAFTALVGTFLHYRIILLSALIAALLTSVRTRLADEVRKRSSARNDAGSGGTERRTILTRLECGQVFLFATGDQLGTVGGTHVARPLAFVARLRTCLKGGGMRVIGGKALADGEKGHGESENGQAQRLHEKLHRWGETGTGQTGPFFAATLVPPDWPPRSWLHSLFARLTGWQHSGLAATRFVQHILSMYERHLCRSRVAASETSHGQAGHRTRRLHSKGRSNPQPYRPHRMPLHRRADHGRAVRERVQVCLPVGHDPQQGHSQSYRRPAYLTGFVGSCVPVLRGVICPRNLDHGKRCSPILAAGPRMGRWPLRAQAVLQF